MKFLIALSVIICSIANIHGLTCSQILELPSDKNWTLLELKTIQPQDLIECLAQLGKDRLPPEQADFIWKTIKSFYEGIDNIPETTLMTLHWVTTAVKPEEYGNLTLDSIDVVQNFGLNYNLSHEQLAAIANRVREDFAGKEPEDYTYYDLVALNQILCQFNRSEIERIHPLAYKEAARMIGKLENCEAESLMGFAALAVSESAFGAPDGWTEATIKTMGVVAEYLPRDLVRQLNSSSSEGNTSSKPYELEHTSKE